MARRNSTNRSNRTEPTNSSEHTNSSDLANSTGSAHRTGRADRTNRSDSTGRTNRTERTGRTDPKDRQNRPAGAAGIRKSYRVPKILLLILVIICVLLIAGSKVYHSSFTGPFSTVAGYIVAPLQNGCAKIASKFSNVSVVFSSKKALQEENEELKERVEELREEINQIEFDTHEYEELQELYELDETYDAYDKVAADIVASDSGNWFNTFLINRGTEDGIEAGMNVIAQGGLVGIVIDCGSDYAKVQSIIDDTCSVSAMDVSTSDYCIVSGSLQTMNESQMIEFSELKLSADDDSSGAQTGDLLVTSEISDKYLKGIPIGYITEIEEDSGSLTQSGTIVPVVDFSRLETVLVILKTRDYADADE